MFVLNSINEIIQWLGVPQLLSTDGPSWTDNILAPSSIWGTGDTSTNPNWGIQPGGTYSSVAVPCSGPVRSMTAYVHRSPLVLSN